MSLTCNDTVMLHRNYYRSNRAAIKTHGLRSFSTPTIPSSAFLEFVFIYLTNYLLHSIRPLKSELESLQHR